mgnify:CR=1 FL=1
MNYVLIGDIHSQAKSLESALSFIRKNISNAKVIFLGDIFDSKTKYSDSYKVYTLVREAERDLNAIILQSNHQDKLIRYLKGNKVHIHGGLERTLNELLKKLTINELYSWLIRQSFGVVFRDEFGIEFRCAHAYFNSDVQIQDYTNEYHIRAIRRDHKHQFLYGLQDDKKNRINWWENDNSSQTFIRVAGHYREVYTNLENKSLILDSNCGEDVGVLSVYNVNERKLYQF